MTDNADREIIFEFIQNGNYVKVVAFDVKTQVEISTIAPANIIRTEQEQAAINKLMYILDKKGLL